VTLAAATVLVWKVRQIVLQSLTQPLPTVVSKPSFHPAVSVATLYDHSFVCPLWTAYHQPPATSADTKSSNVKAVRYVQKFLPRCVQLFVGLL
jgi:hypothetical protein